MHGKVRVQLAGESRVGHDERRVVVVSRDGVEVIREGSVSGGYRFVFAWHLMMEMDVVVWKARKRQDVGWEAG